MSGNPNNGCGKRGIDGWVSLLAPHTWDTNWLGTYGKRWHCGENNGRWLGYCECCARRLGYIW